MCKSYIYTRHCRITACNATRSRMQPRNVYCKSARKARRLGHCPNGVEIIERAGNLTGPCDRCLARRLAPGREDEQQEPGQAEQQQGRDNVQNRRASETVDDEDGSEATASTPSASRSEALDLFRDVFEKPLNQTTRDDTMCNRRKLQLRVWKQSDEQEEGTVQWELEEEQWLEVQSPVRHSVLENNDGDEETSNIELGIEGVSADNHYYGIPTGDQ